MMDTIPDLRRDPAFIAVQQSLQAIADERLATLRGKYGIQGFNSLGGHIRPELRLCNMDHENMFDDRNPELGDIIAIGTVYTDQETTVLVGRLSKDHGDYANWPECPRVQGFRFRWSIDPIAEHVFESKRPTRTRAAA